MLKTWLFLIYIFGFSLLFSRLSFAQKRFSAATCAELLSESSDDKTEVLISVFKHLINEKLIGDTELQLMIAGLEKNEFVNPISEDQAALSSDKKIYRETIDKIAAHSVQYKTLLTWARNAVQEKSHETKSKDETKTQTSLAVRKIQFHPVPPGKFILDLHEENFHPNVYEVNIAHSFEVMDTSVTQYQWTELMGENPSEFAKGPNTLEIDFKGKKIKMQPDHPVENISWWSAAVFANEFSKAHGYKPVYDLSEVGFQGRDERILNYQEDLDEILIIAAKGELVQGKGHEESYAKTDSEDGTIYSANGFRLPIFEEQQYLLAISNKTLDYFSENADELEEYAWFNMHKGERVRSTQSVALLKPQIINGKYLYDLLGNVHEWSGDELNNRYKNIQVGCWSYGKFAVLQRLRRFAELFDRRSYGLRLVRTLK